MIFEQHLLDALERIKSETWEGEVWRVVVGARDPLAANRTGARWNPPDTAALYTSLDEATVLAQLDHLRNLQTPPVKRSLYRLHQIKVRVDKMLDLRDPRLLESLGVDEEQLASDDPRACRQIGGAAAWLGCDAILVPSARGTGDNLVVFVDQQDPDAPLEILWTRQVEE